MDEGEIDEWYNRELEKVVSSYESRLKKEDPLKLNQEYKENLQKLRESYHKQLHDLVEKQLLKKKEKPKKKKEEKKKEEEEHPFKKGEFDPRREALKRRSSMRKFKAHIRMHNALKHLHLLYPIFLTKYYGKLAGKEIAQDYAFVKDGITQDINAVKDWTASTFKIISGFIKRQTRNAFKLGSKWWKQVSGLLKRGKKESEDDSKKE